MTKDEAGDGIVANVPGELMLMVCGGAGEPPVSNVAGEGVPIRLVDGDGAI